MHEQKVEALKATHRLTSALYVDALEVKDFRSLADVTLDFVVPHRNSELKRGNVTLLFGENGSGVSTVLRALVLGILRGDVHAMGGYRSTGNVRRSPSGAALAATVFVHHQRSGPGILPERIKDVVGTQIVHADGAEEVRMLYEAHPEASSSPAAPAFLAAYGSHRTLPPPSRPSPAAGLEDPRYPRVISLMQDHRGLPPPSGWWATSKRRDEIHELLRDLLPSELSLAPHAGGPVQFTCRGVTLPYPGLSTGYRAYLAWIFDLLYHLDTALASHHPLPEASGLVLVDDVDLHMHPRWQHEVIGQVSDAFPNLQFIFTTHSLVLARTVEHHNLRVLRADPTTGATSVSVPDADAWGASIDDMLLHEMWGGPSSSPASRVETSGPGHWHKMVVHPTVSPSAPEESPPDWMVAHTLEDHSSKS